MFGIGPMLPVIPAAKQGGRASNKVQKRKSKQPHAPESHELTTVRRPSTITTQSTLIGTSEEYAVEQPTGTPHHQRDLSLVVDFDLEHAVEQLKGGEISDLELALLSFWIKANQENYLMAKELVRELALDQGYNVDKITNLRVRKLLQEVHDIRPRDPQHASTGQNSFHNQTRNLELSSSGSTRAVSSPLTARIDALPPSLRQKRDLAVQAAARSTMTSNEATGYPPNTPDRPAPLSVKSRGSQISDSTPVPKGILRSVSTPIRAQPKVDLGSITQRDPIGKTGRTEAPIFVGFTAAEDPCRNTGDIFGASHDAHQTGHDPFTNRLKNNEDRRHGTPGRHMYQELGGHASGAYQLDASDVASISSYGTFKSLERKYKNRASTGMSFDGAVISDESFDALESYIGSEDEDDGSVLETVSNISEEEAATQYQFAVQAPSCQLVMAGPVPGSSERRAAADALRKTRAPGLSLQAVNFHRPLPLRSYESEATMFPTAGAQANANHNRSKSVASIIASRRPATQTMAFPSSTDQVQARNSLDEIERDFFLLNNSHTKLSEHINRDGASISQRSSSASTLAAFPIPPMSNPVGELPILISRAAISPQALGTRSLQHPVASTSLEDTYRAIVEVAMAEVLARTRVRGEELQAVELDKLTSFERAWREMNKILLETIYGRCDVVMDETDVAYIDCIARQLRNGSNDCESTNWVRHMFETNV